MWQKVFQAIRFRSEDYGCDSSTTQALLIFDTLIHGEENIKPGHFRSDKEVAVLQSGESCVTGRLTIMIRQPGTESLINAFVDQDPHLETHEEKVLCFFECGEG
jgi:hypothetical protein